MRGNKPNQEDAPDQNPSGDLPHRSTLKKDARPLASINSGEQVRDIFVMAIKNRRSENAFF
jgi:hypothetical protein